MGDRRIGIITTSRADFGIYRPVMRALSSSPNIDAGWIVSGSHLSQRHGVTVDGVEADDAPIWARVECLVDGPQTSENVARSMSRAIENLATVLETLDIDLLVALGDRFEMFACVAAATAFRLPVAHLHGGEITAGALDDAFRHAITKLSHLHFASTAESAQRIRQLGEEAWRVHVSGAPALDAILNEFEPSRDLVDIEGFDCDRDFVLVTYHPETVHIGSTRAGLEAMLHALDEFGWPVLFTGPNADEAGDLVRDAMRKFVAAHPDATYVENVGVPRFYDVMTRARVLVGNSSSGLIEAPSFGLPVVNIGNRQAGRTRAANVIDVAADATEVLEALRAATQPEFASRARNAENPYGDGRASERIAEVLATVSLDDRLIAKQFVDMAVEPVEESV